jgi:hypothetical protein
MRVVVGFRASTQPTRLVISRFEFVVLRPDRPDSIPLGIGAIGFLGEGAIE